MNIGACQNDNAPSHGGLNTGKCPRLIAWELTSACNLKCVHCRACAPSERPAGELSLDQCRVFLNDVAAMEGKPILILTGGEPLIHPDFFKILEHAYSLKMHTVLATNGTLINDDNAARMYSLGVSRASVSIDGHDASGHDDFRKVSGAFESALKGVKTMQKAGIQIQMNTTITRRNISDIEKIFELGVSLRAVAIHIFLLVPTGRAANMIGDEISPGEYESVLNWFYDKKKDTAGRINLKATCAPHYYRIMRQRAKADGVAVDFQTFGPDAVSRGCLAGCGFAFVSSTGIVQGCGYMPVPAGNIRETPFSTIYKDSEFFNRLRDLSNLKGKCGKCEYRAVCGGCRARALAASGDCFEEEPYCNHVPAKK
ncbi:MAG TPA: radical SAM protein [Candidatus Wallbacteria bacterium]|nr:radical SAM protein [Candidatus Wallbacteria bacterium]